MATITAIAVALNWPLGLVRQQMILAQFGLAPALGAYGLAIQIPDQLFILCIQSICYEQPAADRSVAA